jgi:methylmalonyl-CoA mutase cobalamin-binding subunit
MPSPDQAPASISLVERETGLSKDTLRMWERRYGFPRPLRDAKGERLYPSDQIEQLRLIGRLLDLGLRPRELVGLPLEALIARSEGASVQTSAEAARDSAPWEPTFEMLRRYDESGLRSHLSLALQRLGLQRFVTDFAAPLSVQVGEAWARGRITVSQEHLYSEQMQQQLRYGIGAIYPGERAPSVLLTTLPGEEHQLGLLMAQACLAAEGVHCVSLGVQTPAWDIVEAARERGADVVGLSFSQAFRPKVALAMLQDLRARLPAAIEVWAGGALWERAQHVLDGVRFISRLEQIQRLLGAYRESHEAPRTAAR